MVLSLFSKKIEGEKRARRRSGLKGLQRLFESIAKIVVANIAHVYEVIKKINFYIENLFLLKASSLLVFQAAVTKSMQLPPNMAADPIRHVKIKTYNKQWSNTNATYFHSAFDLLSWIHAPIFFWSNLLTRGIRL